MGVTVFDQPYPLVTLEEAKIGLGEDGDYRNAMIDGLIMAAQGEMDGPRGWLGMSVAVQGMEYTADDFSEPICLPYGPVTGAVEIYYLDSDDVEQVVDPATYTVSEGGSVALVSGETWPTGSMVRVRYYAGITDSFDPRVQIMKTAIILHVRMTMDGHEPEQSRKAIESIVRPMWRPVA
jgi:hypothetical protein